MPTAFDGGAAVQVTREGAATVAKLRRVSWLEAAGGVLCDTCVAELSSMTRLTYLSVAQNRAVTSASFPHLAALSHLCSLNISGTSMAEPTPLFLWQLPALRDLSMYCVPTCRGYERSVIQAFPGIRFAGAPQPPE